MKRCCSAVVACCVGIACLVPCPAPAGEGDWTILFDGATFTGWEFDVMDGSAPETIWRIEDGIVVAAGKGKSTSVLRTAETFANYELELEWRWPDKPGNSGVLVHCSSPRRMNVWPQSIEVQLATRNAGDFWVIGETIDVPEDRIAKGRDGQPSRRRLNLTDDSENAPGEWNHIRVVVRDATITVHVNGDLVNRGTNCSTTSGAICLQAEGADIQFRNIRLRPLPPDGE